jgi:hypothetical protein
LSVKIDGSLGWANDKKGIRVRNKISLQRGLKKNIMIKKCN